MLWKLQSAKAPGVIGLMSTFYHGTVATFVPQIKREGLRPDARHAWKVHFDHFDELIPPTPNTEPGVYVTTSKEHAIAYAQTRADYFQRKPGECFEFYQEIHDKADRFLFLSKDLDAPVVLHTIPVLVTLNFDPVDYPLEHDYDDDEHAFICHTPLPPTVVSEVQKLEPKYNSSPFSKAVRAKMKAASDAYLKAHPEDEIQAMLEMFR